MSTKTVAVAQARPREDNSGSEVRLSEQDIAVRANEIYLERGAADGDALEDWLRAERELKERKKA